MRSGVDLRQTTTAVHQIVGHAVALAPGAALQDDSRMLGALEAVDAHHRAAIRRPAQPAQIQKPSL